ncbi:MAG: hypothetical protein QJT81_05170 [Candidatus Thiothrix putei]|uniref:Uncharacterized protein n=1 Tax=Candidatus Thiothrix putei TaxID=3080811 RepID=A0AA95HIV7_9GAMM|nr:MAG: hypothetical protein QJT81_05170 [Candidatus Thiothrix putei]
MLRWFFAQPLHLRIAIMIAPILAIGGWGMMDLWVTKDQPKPTVEQQVAMLPLQLQGECFLATNQCLLQHDKMKLSMLLKDSGKPGIVRMEIIPDTNIRGIQMSLVQLENEHQIVVTSTPDGNLWFAEFPDKLLTPSPSALRIALAKFGSVSFAEIQPHF